MTDRFILKWYDGKYPQERAFETREALLEYVDREFSVSWREYARPEAYERIEI